MTQHFGCDGQPASQALCAVRSGSPAEPRRSGEKRCLWNRWPCDSADRPQPMPWARLTSTSHPPPSPGHRVTWTGDVAARPGVARSARGTAVMAAWKFRARPALGGAPAARSCTGL